MKASAGSRMLSYIDYAGRMRRVIYATALCVILALPCRGSIIVNWLDTPAVLWTESGTMDVSIDLDGNGVIDFIFRAGTSILSVQPQGINLQLIWPWGPPDAGGLVEPLLEAYELGVNSEDSGLRWFGNDEFTPLGSFLWQWEENEYVAAGRFPGHRAYVGVAFDISGATHYGWIDVWVSPDNPYGEIYGWAYDSTSGMSIQAGAIPEPSTVLLLSCGTIALALMKRRQLYR